MAISMKKCLYEMTIAKYPDCITSALQVKLLIKFSNKYFYFLHKNKFYCCSYQGLFCFVLLLSTIYIQLILLNSLYVASCICIVPLMTSTWLQVMVVSQWGRDSPFTLGEPQRLLPLMVIK
jgi:hypothetical protein